MGQARELMDKVTAAVVGGDTEGLGRLYAPDAVAITPDAGELHGRDEIVDYMRTFMTAFPDTHFDMTATNEAGDTAIDEGYLVGTHTGPLATPDGEVPPTGRSIRLRECDVVVVDEGLIREHRFYYDQADFMQQLGLVPA